MSNLNNALPPSHDAFVGFALGVAFFILAATAIKMSLSKKRDVYDLDHWKLNVDAPFHSMWMNMGFWKTREGDEVRMFSEACRRLLEELLLAAKLLPQDERVTRRGSLAILDLGIGCGDQSLALHDVFQDSRPLGYVGLTAVPSQAELASTRLAQRSADKSRIFHADAAKPHQWSPSISEAVRDMAEKASEKWILGLDSLYHFAPSREPIFHHAAKLDASIMAYDLLLGDSDKSWSHRWTLVLVGLLMGCPRQAFLAEQDYRAQLVKAGYHAKNIEIKDVTADVLPGLVGYIDEQARRLKVYGIGMGKFKIASAVFRWGYETGIVKAVFVVARREETRGEDAERDEVGSD